MRKLTLIVMLLASTLVVAQQDYPRDITLDWVNADQYVDGSIIQPGDLVSVRLECFRNQDATPVVSATVPAAGEGLPQTETLVGVIPAPGNYQCFAYSVVVGGIESDASNSASRKYTGKPLPPQAFE